MASNAERLISQTLGQPEQQDTPDAYLQTGSDASKQRNANEQQPNWDVPSLFQLDKRQETNKPVSGDDTTTQFQQPAPLKEQLPARKEVTPETITYTSPFAPPRSDTYKSPYGSILPKAKPEPTAMELLSKPMTDLTLEDVGAIAKDFGASAKNWLGTVDSDYAAMTGLFVRFRTEYAVHRFPTSSSAIYGMSAAGLTGLSAYALKSDAQDFYNSTSTKGKIFNGASSALDATALAGSLMAVFPRTRAVGTPIAALSFFARAGVGVASKIFDKNEK